MVEKAGVEVVKMPSVERSTKTTEMADKRGSAAGTATTAAEVETPVKMCITVLDKKLRNLEKRKVHFGIDDNVLFVIHGSSAHARVYFS